MSTRTKFAAALATGCLLATWLPGCGSQLLPIPTIAPADEATGALPPGPVRFENHSAASGLLLYSETFSVSAADVDGDLRDDLLVGNHGSPPRLFLNRDAVFEEASELLPIEGAADRHVYTLVDFDNDGDRDFIFAGGGADGIGEGEPNGLFRNTLSETGEPGFVDVTGESDIAYRQWRSRAFLPVANPGGDRVDLYLVSLHGGREDTTNLYFTNGSSPGTVRFAVERDSTLNRRIESDGKGLFFDYDRDGDVDYLHISHLGNTLYRNEAGRFSPIESPLDRLGPVESAAVADFDNDGFPDLYLGRISGHTYSDNVSANGTELHFVVFGQPGDSVDRMSLSTASRSINIDFRQHLPAQGKARTDASDIYLGKAMSNPARRTVRIKRKDALGAPADTRSPGTYIWFEPQTGLWQVLWRHPGERNAVTSGIIRGKSLRIEGTENFETSGRRGVSDHVLVNQKGKGWKLLATPVLDHDAWTNDVTAADFNNDGRVDIAGVRAHDEGRENGSPFLVLNRGGFNFEVSTIMENGEDDIFRADLIVHGFFDDDGLPDLFYTNGYGLKPSNRGPYQLWLNRTVTGNGFLLLELEGTAANRDAIGAQVEVYGSDGTLLGYRELGPGYGRSQDSHKLHFGLGSAPPPYRVEVRWPGAAGTQTFTLDAAGFHHLVQG